MGCILLIKFVSSTFDFKISGNAEEIVISLVISETGLFLSECGHAWQSQGYDIPRTDRHSPRITCTSYRASVTADAPEGNCL